MKQNFERALKEVLKDEGGNDDDPQDHGGRTSRGITQREYNAWCRLNAKPQSDVWHASDSDIKSIYHDQYWEPYCDQFGPGVDYSFFDVCVNAGRQQAVRTFQKALGTVKVDGMMGQVTLAAIADMDDKELITKVAEVRRRFYRSLAQFPRYGRGWLRRVDHCEQVAMKLAGSDKTYHVPETVKIPKAKDQPTAQAAVSPETSGAVATTSGSFAGVLDQFKESLSPFATELKFITYALIGIAFTTLGYAVYGVWKRKKSQEAQ